MRPKVVVVRYANVMTLIEWPKPTRHSVISAGNQRIYLSWLAKLLSSATVILVFPLISRALKPPLRQEFCPTTVSDTKPVRPTRAQPTWTGWNKSKNAVLQLIQQRPQPSGEVCLVTILRTVSTSLIRLVTWISPLRLR